MGNTKFEVNGPVLTVRRTFDATINLVWKAWTEAILLDQWWAPKPWKSVTKSMEFKVGGHRLYAMVGPEGEEHWGKTAYLTIVHHVKFTGEDAFCDSEGQVNPEMPVGKFSNSFSEKNGQTEVVVVTEYASEELLSQVIAMGMKEGLSMAYENLDGVLTRMR